MMPRFTVRILALSGLLLAVSVQFCPADELDFATDIRPLLSDRCFACHGPDAENRKSDLRLDVEQDAKEWAIVAGMPDASAVIERITSADPELRMPPPSSKLSLSPEEIERIRTWIQQGAAWSEHWSFQPLQPEQPPKSDAAWPQNEIDQFIWRRMRAARLEPAPPAARETLLRRLTFDLTGVPPSLEELDAFLTNQDPLAVEHVVDRLFKSPRFGERMASPWLDVARYSDTYGYQVDRDRYVWPWRDWVIRAFNQGKGYDQFILEQLAGDLLPQATDDQVLATTFNRLHPQKVEGGSTPEEFRCEYVADRTQTFATAMLGLTLECARCHDHKYDPLTQLEYYQLTAYFDNIDEAGLYSFFTSSVPTPTLRLSTVETKRRLADLTSRIGELEARLSELRQPPNEDSKDPENGRRRAAYRQWLAAFQKSLTSPAGAPGQQGALPVPIERLDFAEVKPPNQQVDGPRGLKAVRLTGDDGIGLKVGNFRRFQPFTVALWMRTPDIKSRAVIFHRSRAWTDAGSRGYQLLVEDGKLSASLIHFWPGNAMRVKSIEMLPTNQWLHVVFAYDGSSKASGITLYLNGRPVELEVVRDQLDKNITGGGGDQITIGERFRDRGFSGGDVSDFQVFDRCVTADEVAWLHAPEPTQQRWMREVEQLARTGDLFQRFLEQESQEYQQGVQQLQSLRKQLCELQDSQQEIMVMREMAQPRTTHFLKRGAYDQKGEPVEPGTPKVLPPWRSGTPANRLELAQWLLQPNHPLTARVAVNRLWQMMFGEGLVRTPEDFGSQGQTPTHPQLLDWLAWDLIQHDWNLRRTLKLIATSATYQQASATTVEKSARDPQNLWLSRFPTYRLPAEMLRDQALFVSGLLVEKQGGPPVRPYDLAESFKPSKPDQGDGLYRRSVYTYWKRTGPAPLMMTLDASKRDVCRVKREKTSTPLQAFALLNGPQFVESARALSALLLTESPGDVEGNLRQVFRRLTSRWPSDDETRALRSLYHKERERFAADAERTNQYLAVGAFRAPEPIPRPELAALSLVANMLMNFDESAVKH